VHWLARHRLVIATTPERIPRVVLAMEIPVVVEIMHYAGALVQLRTLKIQLYLP
jgi:hypothetical protein